MPEFRFTVYAGVPEIIVVEADSEEAAWHEFHDQIAGNVLCEVVEE